MLNPDRMCVASRRPRLNVSKPLIVCNMIDSVLTTSQLGSDYA